MNGELSVYERAVMDAALEGDHPVLEALRRQLRTCRVKERSQTGVGFFTEFEVDTSLSPANRKDFQIGDVAASVKGLKHGAGFVIFVKDGYLSMLEGYSFEESWPREIEEFEIEYETKGTRDLGGLGLSKALWWSHENANLPSSSSSIRRFTHPHATSTGAPWQRRSECSAQRGDRTLSTGAAAL